MLFWKRKKSEAQPDADEPAAEDRLERQPDPEPEKLAEPPQSEPPAAPAPVAKPDALEATGQALSGTQNGRARNGARRSPEQRLLEDPVRIFGEVSSLMARDPVYAARSIADLGWIIRPAIATRQVLVARTKSAETAEGAKTAVRNDGPIAFVAWASVSDEIDVALREGNGLLDALRPHAEGWRSGGNMWIVALAGPQSVRSQLLKHLRQKAPEGRPPSQLTP